MNHLLSSKGQGNDPNKLSCTCENPTKCLSTMFVDVVQELRKGACPVKRPVFLRTHGVIQGKLKFEDNIPKAYQQGLLDPKYRIDPKNPKKKTPSTSTHPVYIRFSSDLSDGRPDLNSTVGVGIKIYNIAGDKCISDDGANTADLLLQNMPNFFVDNAREMCEFTRAGFTGWSGDWIAQNSPKTADILAAMEKYVPSVLATDYWSVVPFRLGVKEGCKDDGVESSYNYCKFIVRPTQSTYVGEFNTDDPNYLGKELTTRMSKGSANLDVYIQVRPDEKEFGAAYLDENYPLDKLTVVWEENEQAPIIKVATISLPKQKIDKQEQEDYGNWLAFNIGRVPKLSKPVGSIAETRMEVYKYSATRRRDDNKQPNEESGTPGAPKIPYIAPKPAPQAKSLTPDEIKRITHVRVHPGIGVSRLGDSKKYYIGPEVMNPIPTEPDLVNGLYGDDTTMRDKYGKLKRQAARFRVYGYDKNGNVVAEVQQSANTSVEWNVHVANKKSDWFYFIAAMDVPEYKDLVVKRRNGSIQAGHRGSLIIDPGPKSIMGINMDDSSYQLNGKFHDTPVMLGELKTDEVGRLLFVPGLGKSGSPSGQPPYNSAKPDSFSNATDWYDDICDGPVHASVLIDGKEFEADPGWVISSPPNYAPNIIGWRTMNDMMRNVFIDGGMMDLPTTISFTEHIHPILQRLTGLQWVNKGFSSLFGADGPMNFNNPSLLKKLAYNTNGSPAPDTYRELRRTIYNNLRAHGNQEEAKASWPMIYGDTSFSPDSIAKEKLAKGYLRVPPLFDYYLKKWVDGDFKNDYDPENQQAYQIFDRLPLEAQPDMLDQAAMHFCLADAFHPGCELTWPMRHISMYRAPYRIREAASNQSEPSYGSMLDTQTTLKLGGPLYAQWAGNLTRWMAIPWQGDTAYCRAGYAPEFDPYVPAYWPARVPNHVLTQANYHVFCDTSKSEDERLAAFHNRPQWLRHIMHDPTTKVMENMVHQFGQLGIIEAREVSESLKEEFPWLSDYVYVETLTPTREAQIAEAMKLFDEAIKSATFSDPLIAEAGWFSEEQKDEYERIQRRG